MGAVPEHSRPDPVPQALLGAPHLRAPGLLPVHVRAHVRHCGQVQERLRGAMDAQPTKIAYEFDEVRDDFCQMSTSDSSTYNKVSPAVTVLATTGIIAGGAVLIVIAILIIKCVEKTKQQSVSAEEQLPNVSATSSHGSTLRKDLTVDMGPIYKFLEDIEKEKPMRFTPHHLVHFTNNYAEKLGSGGFGVVYRGRFPNGVKVAVKVLHGTTTSDKRTEEQFMAEIGTICRTSHANLVRLYGFCFDEITKALVYEYMEKGSLDQYLFNHNDRIEWGKLREIAIGAAKAIRCLHEEHEPSVVHYDIKPGNILLDADFTPRVSDLGLAKLCDRGDVPVTLTGARGTPGYAAPELWMPLPVTHKCDVYSFGMVLFEILGRRRNLDVRRGERQEWYPRWVWQKHEQGDLESVIADSGVESKYQDKARTMCRVALLCVQHHPESRPSMNSVVRMLEEEEEIIAMPSSSASSQSPWSFGAVEGSNSRGSVTGSSRS
ncbi:unnamed protein product [Musa hybrid cultivar]